MLTTVYSNDEQAHVHFLQGVLAEQGVRSFIADENLVMVDSLMTHAVGGIKLQVLAQHVDAARAIIERELASMRAIGEADPAVPLAEDDEPDELDALLTCGQCGSRNVVTYRPWFWLALFFPPLFLLGMVQRKQCQDCGATERC